MRSNMFERQSEFVSTDSGMDKKISETHPGMAHFAGTGFTRSTCTGCEFFTINARKTKGTCGKFSAMMGRKGPSFPPEALSCKYYEARSKKI